MSKNSTLLIISGSIAFMGYGLISVLIPILAKLEGNTDFNIGLLGVSFYIGLIVGSYSCSSIVRRVGHARAFTFSSTFWALTPILFFLIKDIYIWFLLMGIVGFCFSTNRVIVESWLNDIATARSRVYLISTYVMMIFLAAAIGQNLINLSDERSLTLFAIVALLLIISSLPISLTTAAIPKPPQNISLKIIWAFRLSPIAIIVCFMNGLINSAHISFSAVFILDKGLSLSVAAAFMSSITAGGALLQIPVSYLYQKLGYFVSSSLLCIISIYTAYSLQQEIYYAYWYVILGFIFGGCIRPLYSISVSFANAQIAREDMVRMSGSLTLLYSVGSLTGAIIIAIVANNLGVKMLFSYMLSIQLILMIILFFSLFKRKRDTRENFETVYDQIGDMLNPRRFV